MALAIATLCCSPPDSCDGKLFFLFSSPTFSIVHEYEASAFPVYHFDMYRVNSCDDLYSTGYFDYIYTGVLLIEWSENIIEWLPKDVINVYIRKEGEETRKIIFEGNDKFEGVGN